MSLDQEIQQYIDLPESKVPNFEKDNRLDSDFYVIVWENMTTTFRNVEWIETKKVPDMFIRLCKLVLTLSHGQGPVERSFR